MIKSILHWEHDDNCFIKQQSINILGLLRAEYQQVLESTIF